MDPIFVNAAVGPSGEQIGLTLVNVHSEDQCRGRQCCIHNPSDHHMVTWPQNWRDDRGLMERICPHGVGHPDPDDLYYKELVGGPEKAYWESIHGCCGCCTRSTSDGR